MPSADAESCFADPLCDPAVAARTFDEEERAGRPVDCARLVYGIGVRRAPARGRACLERAVQREGACGDQSPTLDRLMLAVMVGTGQGGAADRPAALALLSGCFADASVTGVRDALATARSDGGAPLDFCRDVGGTTLATDACLALDRRRADAEEKEAGWPLVSALDASKKAAYASAARAWALVAKREGDVAADAYRGGTMSSAVFSSVSTRLVRDRAARLRALSSYVPDAAADAMAADASVARAEKERLARARDAHARALVVAADDAWTAYRDAEAALYEALFASRPGADAVGRDARARVDQAWMAASRRKDSP